MLKYRLVDPPGCGGVPQFELCSGSMLADVPVAEIGLINAWITQNYMGWAPLGWVFFGLIRFVRNDLLMRSALVECVKSVSSARSDLSFEVVRSVRTYGYGETSVTVVKVKLIVTEAGVVQAPEQAIEEGRLRRTKTRKMRTTQEASDPSEHREDGEEELKKKNQEQEQEGDIEFQSFSSEVEREGLLSDEDGDHDDDFQDYLPDQWESFFVPFDEASEA